MIHTLLKNITTDTPGPTAKVGDPIRNPQGVFHVVNSGGAGGGVVILEGRVSTEAPWATVASVSLTGNTPQLVAVAAVGEMRARVNTPIPISASVSAWLQSD